MGCCLSLLPPRRQKTEEKKKKNNNGRLQQQNQNQYHQQQNKSAASAFNATSYASSNGPGVSNGNDAVTVPGFSEFSLAELRAATNNFSSDFIVSESGEKAPNVVYKGRLQNNNNRRWIAVKKFAKLAWPDPKQFAVRHLQLSHFIFPVQFFFFYFLINFIFLYWCFRMKLGE